ncbi:hypothetical protein [Vibrio cholerae]
MDGKWMAKGWQKDGKIVVISWVKLKRMAKGWQTDGKRVAK